MTAYVTVNGARITLRLNVMQARAYAAQIHAERPDAVVAIQDADAWDQRAPRPYRPSMSPLSSLTSR